MSYTLNAPVSAATVLPSNFLLTYGENLIDAKNVIYYPAKNLLYIETDFVSSIEDEYVALSTNGILNTNSESADFSGKASLMRLLQLSPHTAGTSAVYCMLGDEPLYNLLGRTGITVVVRIANSTAADVTGLKVKVYDGDTFVAEESASVASEDFTDIVINTNNHTFSNNSPTIVVE